MKAIVQSAYVPPELLQFSEIEKPAPGEGEVLVRVLAGEAAQAVRLLGDGKVRGKSVVVVSA